MAGTAPGGGIRSRPTASADERIDRCRNRLRRFQRGKVGQGVEAADLKPGMILRKGVLSSEVTFVLRHGI